jgi:short subunit dehydrogenase-like uncharacterized protein
MQSSTIAIIGAAGHTGRFVADEVTRRGLRAIRIGRNAEKLASTNDAKNTEKGRIVQLNDPASLDAALAGADIVINCAGPFIDTAATVIDAAMRANISYLDVAAEQATVQNIFQEYDTIARAAGLVVLPGAAFFGGMADLLASAIASDDDKIEKLAVAVGLDSWHPTKGTRLTGERNKTPKVIQRAGRLAVMPTVAETAWWNFPAPIGRREIVMVPMSEIITLSSHLTADRIESWMNIEALQDLRSSTPLPNLGDGILGSPQRFAMEVVVDVNGQSSRVTAVGRDIYYTSAQIVVEAAERLLNGQTKVASGVYALGSAFHAQTFLNAMQSAEFGFSFEISLKSILDEERTKGYEN